METAKTHTLDTDAARVDKKLVSSRTFPADRTAPRAAAAWLRTLPSGLSATRLSDAELCLDELVTNVVRYAWTEPGTDVDARTLTVRVEQSATELEITVEDAGRAFDPGAATLAPMPRTLDEAVPGGRGLFLVRSIAPRVAYERRDGVNRTTIAFPLDAPAS